DLSVPSRQELVFSRIAWRWMLGLRARRGHPHQLLSPGLDAHTDKVKLLGALSGSSNTLLSSVLLFVGRVSIHHANTVELFTDLFSICGPNWMPVNGHLEVAVDQRFR